jgi:hypothetical protein
VTLGARNLEETKAGKSERLQNLMQYNTEAQWNSLHKDIRDSRGIDEEHSRPPW